MKDRKILQEAVRKAYIKGFREGVDMMGQMAAMKVTELVATELPKTMKFLIDNHVEVFDELEILETLKK